MSKDILSVENITLGAVAGQAVDNYLWREDAQTLLEQVDIVLRREHLELSGSIIRLQIQPAPRKRRAGKFDVYS